jgi:Uma2 family endonuclease
MSTTLPAAPPANVAGPPTTGCAVVINGTLQIPPNITDLASFRRWAHSDAFPEEGRIAYLNGTIWIDLSPEELYSHNQVKGEVGILAGTLVNSLNSGRYVADGMRLSNPDANLSTVPDGSYVSYATFQSGRLRQIPGRHGGVVELEGTPYMVLEVVSESSVEKDAIILPPLYQAARIREFWRIDARGELRFEILHLAPTGWTSAQLSDGWWRSNVFGRDFLLVRHTDPLLQPAWTLQVRG